MCPCCRRDHLDGARIDVSPNAGPPPCWTAFGHARRPFPYRLARACHSNRVLCAPCRYESDSRYGSLLKPKPRKRPTGDPWLRSVGLVATTLALTLAAFNVYGFCSYRPCGVHAMQASILGLSPFRAPNQVIQRNSTSYDDIAFHYHGWYQRYISDTVEEKQRNGGHEKPKWISENMRPSTLGIQLRQSRRTKIVQDFATPNLLGNLRFRPPTKPVAAEDKTNGGDLNVHFEDLDVPVIPTDTVSAVSG